MLILVSKEKFIQQEMLCSLNKSLVTCSEICMSSNNSYGMILFKHRARLCGNSMHSKVGLTVQGQHKVNRIYVSTYLLSRPVYHTGHPLCQPYNLSISVWHYGRCWPIDLNATVKVVLLSSQTHPIQWNKDHSLFNAEGLEEVISQNRALNFFYIIAPCGYHTPNHKFLMTAVTSHSAD